MCDVAQLLTALGGHEPQVRAVGALLVGHSAGLEMAIGTTRRHHRNLDVVDQAVEFVELAFHVFDS